MLFAFFAYAAQACSCFYISEYFCPTVSWMNTNGGSNELYIAQVKVVSLYGYYMDVEVVEDLQNGLPESLTILGQDGLNCNEWLSNFEAGNHYIVGINESYWEEEVYDLSGCGKFWLSVTGDKVQGNIAEGIQEQNYEVFRQSLAECAAISSAEEPGLPDIRVFPNPTSGELYLNGMEPEAAIDYAVYNLSGQILGQGKISAGSSPSLSLNGLPAALYVLRLQTGKAILTKRVILQPD